MEEQQYSLTSPGVQSPTKLYKTMLGLRVIEARLCVNVAKFGDMKPYAVVTYGSQVWKTASSLGMKPVWNSYFELLYGTLDVVTVEIYHKAMLIGDVEIGKANISLKQVSKHDAEWWELRASSGEDTGQVLLAFDFTLSGLLTEGSLMLSAHSPTGSAELRRNFNFDSTEALRPRERRRRANQASEMALQSEEQLTIEQMRRELEDEKTRIEKQEGKVRKLFQCLEQENTHIKREKEEVRKLKEDILQREERLISAREATENDRKKLEEENRKVEELKDSLNQGYRRLKMDKQKLKAKKRLLETASVKNDGTSRKLEKQKQELQRQIQGSKDSESNYQQEWAEIEELRQVLKEQEELLLAQDAALAKDRLALEQERRDLEALRGTDDIAEEETDKQPISVMVISEQVKHRVVNSESSHLRLALSPAKY
jgi:hypothetical protein